MLYAFCGYMTNMAMDCNHNDAPTILYLFFVYLKTMHVNWPGPDNGVFEIGKHADALSKTMQEYYGGCLQVCYNNNTKK